jgi:hypothetical protein
MTPRFDRGDRSRTTPAANYRGSAREGSGVVVAEWSMADAGCLAATVEALAASAAQGEEAWPLPRTLNILKASAEV